MCDVGVDAPDHALTLVEDVDPAAAGRLEIVLPRGATVLGRVVDLHGTPIPRALVSYDRIGPFGAFGGAEHEVAAADDGTFRIDGLPAGLAVLDVVVHQHDDTRRCPRAEFRAVPGAARVDVAVRWP